jgi:hypothetical protein
MRFRIARLVVALVVLAAGAHVPARKSGAQTGPAANTAQAPTPAANGYWLVGSDGGVFSYGGASFAGSTGAMRLNRDVVAMAPAPTGRGYWLAASDGGVFAFGGAPYAGSTADRPLRAGVVGLAATPSGNGYWLVASDGGVFAFGDAFFAGSAGDRPLSSPVVGMAAVPTGRGYWLVTADGTVRSYGDAAVHPGAGALRRGDTVVGMAPSPSGRGYWVATAAGDVLAFGDAPVLGSRLGQPLTRPIVGIAAAPRGLGYWLVAGDGGVFTFGDAAFAGSAGGTALSRPVVGMAAAPLTSTPRTGIFTYPWYATMEHDDHWRHWEQGGHLPPTDIGANFYPARGVYSSLDRDGLAMEARQIAATGVDQIITSWWGRGAQGDFENRSLPVVVETARAAGLDVAVHLEPYRDRTPATVRDDITYLRSYGVTDVYLYEIDRVPLPATDWAPVLAAFPDTRFFVESGNLEWTIGGGFATYVREMGADGIYTYDPVRYGAVEMAWTCAAARRERLLCAPSVAPGYDARRAKPLDQRVVDPRAGARYDEQWAGALAAGADTVTVTSWNEWHEGTQIEPARPYCFTTDGYCTSGYEGVYGRTGQAAETAYLDRTNYWIAIYRKR